MFLNSKPVIAKGSTSLEHYRLDWESVRQLGKVPWGLRFRV